MICRRLKKENDVQNVVWFGSYGKNLDGTAKFYNYTDKHDNYSKEQDGVKDSLTQRLSVIQQELWYNINYGLPLMENIYTKVAIDGAVVEIVMSHPDVEEILSFVSEKKQHDYFCKMIIKTKYGEINFSI